MFLDGTVEDKRFILQTVISNSSYYDGKLDVELHPVLIHCLYYQEYMNKIN